MDSSNSSKPPSSDSIYKRSERVSFGKKSKRKPGGQAGHKGSKLKKFDKVDHYEDHIVSHCSFCKSCNLQLKSVQSRQVVDIPEPRIEVTEHKIYEYKCLSCGSEVSSKMKNHLKQEVQYGPRIKGFVNYLNVHQLIPYKRTVELIEDVYGHSISEGSISNFNRLIEYKLTGFLNKIKDYFINTAEVIHSDETGCMVSKELHWMHVCSDKDKTLLKGHKKRGGEAMEEMGVLNKAKGTLIHDRFSPYFKYEHIQHGLCNAHLLRELKALEKDENLSWPKKTKETLLKAKKYKDAELLSQKEAEKLLLLYEKILERERPHYNKIMKEKIKKVGRTKRTKDHNLYNALWKYRKEILLFMFQKAIPFDNNQAERDLRMFKVKMKISNQFKNLEGLNTFATIKSFISTARKQKRNALECLIKTHEDHCFAIQLAE